MPRGMSWHDYNESLVERGRVLFDLGFASDWNDELDGMTSDKKGRPYEFPDSYIEFLSFFRVGLNTPYRVIEGMTEALSEYLTLVKEIHFTHVRRRILAMVKRKKPEYVDRIAEGIDDDDPMTVVVDSTGLSTTCFIPKSFHPQGQQLRVSQELGVSPPPVEHLHRCLRLAEVEGSVRPHLVIPRHEFIN